MSFVLWPGPANQHNKPVKTITLNLIQQKLATWTKKGLITQEKDTYIVDLKTLGYHKVLGTGRLTDKVKILNATYTKKAAEKLGVKIEAPAKPAKE